jgi:hypothetical protein
MIYVSIIPCAIVVRDACIAFFNSEYCIWSMDCSAILERVYGISHFCQVYNNLSYCRMQGKNIEKNREKPRVLFFAVHILVLVIETE